MFVFPSEGIKHNLCEDQKVLESPWDPDPTGSSHPPGTGQALLLRELLCSSMGWILCLGVESVIYTESKEMDLQRSHPASNSPSGWVGAAWGGAHPSAWTKVTEECHCTAQPHTRLWDLLLLTSPHPFPALTQEGEVGRGP